MLPLRVCLFLIAAGTAGAVGAVDAVRVRGPGIDPRSVVLPARYFFVEGASDGDDLSIRISGRSQSGSCRLWFNRLDLKDGTFIVRYRLYETCTDFQIDVLYKNEHVEDSPYFFTGPIYHENCYCPVDDFSRWSDSYGCPKRMDRIDRDMEPFDSVNMTAAHEDVLRRFDRPGSVSICHYVIKNNELFRKCYGNHVGFHIFSDAILLSVLRKVAIPDQSFFFNLGDWPLVKKNEKFAVPVFSWCGSDDTHDIVLPTYELTESTLENMGRVMLDMLSVQGNIDKKWNEKIPKAFWRGRDSRRERLDLIDIARENPTLYNASLTNFFFFKDLEEKYGPKVPHTSFFKFFDYKYQINIDGTVASYRFPYLLAGDSLVFKQDSPYYEHFYHQLQPGKHYIPFTRDLSDLTEKIQWAIDNDEEAKGIAENGQKFARNFLMPKDIICYYAIAFNEWSKRIITPIEILQSMEKVPQTDINNDECMCAEKHIHQKDEL